VMNKLLLRLSLWLQTLWSRLKVRGAEQRLHQRELDLAIERIVDQANPALRGFGGYRHKLSRVVEYLLHYSDELVMQIPGPTMIDPDSWSSDPLVNALFGDVQRIRHTVSGRVVRNWLKQHPVSSGDNLYALLAVHPVERSQLGMELIRDQVQRDVKQTTLSFKDHELHAVTDTLDATRQALRAQVVDLIASLAIADIVAQEERIAALEQAVRMLRLKLKVINPRAGAVDLTLSNSGEHLAERDRLRKRLRESERDLADASRGLGDIEEYLQRLIALLDHPERHIGLQRMHLWLDHMNIVRDRYHADANEIELVRGRRLDQPGRVVQFICFPRSLVLSADERLAEVERHFGL
jgi:hypothetical protein